MATATKELTPTAVVEHVTEAQVAVVDPPSRRTKRRFNPTEERLLSIFRGLPQDVKDWIKLYSDLWGLYCDRGPNGFEDAFYGTIRPDVVHRAGEPRIYHVPECKDRAWLEDYLRVVDSMQGWD